MPTSNDSDLIGTHSRLQLAINLTDWMAGEGKDVTLPTLDPTWYNGYINSMSYVAINTLISVTIALPAAYTFSRYRFLGDKHLFFWLLTNRMAPPAVFALLFFQLY